MVVKFKLELTYNAYIAERKLYNVHITLNVLNTIGHV